MKKAFRYIAAYLLLLPILFLGMWLFLLGREVLSGLLSTYYVGGSFMRGYQAGFFDRMFTLGIGLSWLILFVVAEELLRRSTQKGNSLKVFSRFMGIELFLALALDGAMLIFLSGFSVAGWLRWLLLGIELLGGAVFTFLGWSERSPLYDPRKPWLIEPPANPQKSSR